MVDGKGSNSWESIRRWCLQFGLKDNPNSRHTELFFPDDETSLNYPISVYQDTIGMEFEEYLVNFK